MTTITYENGRLNINQYEMTLNFSIADLNFESRQQLINSIQDIK